MSKRSPGLIPADLTASLIADGEWVNEVKLYQRLFGYLNRLRGALVPLQTVWKAHARTVVSVPDSTWTIMPLDTLDVDLAGLGIASSGFPVPATGIYQVSATGHFNPSSLGSSRWLAVGVDSASGGGETGAKFTSQPTTSGGIIMATPTVLVPATAGQIITVDQFQDSGGGLGSGDAVNAGSRASLTVWRWA